MGANLIPADSALFATLSACERKARCVVLAGLPGIGKSLLTRQMALIARDRGRVPALMQWDTVRDAFETHPAGNRFPSAAGVAHPVVRLAADGWTRTGVGRWLAAAPADGFLIIEAPLIGGRMMSLARPADDTAEMFLSRDTLFLLPVPTQEVKTALRRSRGRDEAQDPSLPFASVDVLDGLVREINAIAVALGALPSAVPEYDPEAYAGVYLHAMRGRSCRRIEINTVFDIAPTAATSEPLAELAPADDEVRAAFGAAEALAPDVAEARLGRWYA